MKTLTLNIPDSVDMNEKEISIILTVQLYDKSKLSLGQAADLVALTKREFMDELGAHGVSIFGETLEDIDRALKNV